MLEEMLDRWRRGARGPLPQLTSVQLLNALVLIDQDGPVGRRALAQALQIKVGAEGALTIAVVNGKLSIPPDNKTVAELSPGEDSRIRELFHPAEKDLVIIGFGKDANRALSGALAAVLSLGKH